MSVATATSDVGSISAGPTSTTTNYFVWTVGDRFKPGSNAVMRIDCTLPDAGSYTNLAHVITSTGDYEPSNDTDDHIVTVGSLPELTIDLILTNKCYGEEMWIDPTRFIASIDGTNSTARLTGFTVSFTNAAGEVVSLAPTNAAAKVARYYITLSNLISEPAGVFGDRVTIKSGIFDVTNRCLTIKASATNKVYGTTIAFTGTEFTTDPATLPNGETITSVTLTSKTGAAGNAAASVDIYVDEIEPSNPQGTGGFDPNNYKIDPQPGTLTVTKASLAVAAPNIVKIYDGAGTNVTAAIIGDQPIEGNVPTYLYSADPDGPYVDWQNLQYTNVVFNEGAVSSNRVWYKVSTMPENYFAATNWAWVTITPRPLTVKADDATKKPGTPDPDPFAWSVVEPEQSIVSGEETAVYLSLTNDVGVSEKLDRTPGGETPGDHYTITTNAPFASFTAGALANYALAFAPGKLTIEDRELLTLSVANTNVVYGAEDPTGSGPGFDLERAEPKGFLRDKVFGLGEVTFGTDYNRFAPVDGVYTIFTNSTALRSDYYSITVVPGKLTVTPAPLTIVASNAVKVYGTTLTLTGTEFHPPVGLVNGETVTNVALTCAQASLPEASVGDYTIALTAPLLGDHGFSEANYALDPTNGTLTVTPATIATPAPGEEPPAEPDAAWTQAANIIKCYDGLGTNIWPTQNLPFEDTASYLFSTNPAGPFVAWENLQFTNVVFDAYGNVTSNRVYYTITTDKAGIANYFAATNSAYVMITQHCVTVTADNTNKVYGTTLTLAQDAFRITAGSLAGDEKITAVSITSKTGKAGNAAAPVDIYADEIEPHFPVTGTGGFNPSNYAIAFSNGALTVTKAALTVSAPSIVKVYDGAGTNVTAAIDGGEPEGHAVTYRYSTIPDGPYVAWQDLQFTNVVFGSDGSIASNRVYYTVSTEPEDYFAATNFAWVTITQRPVELAAAWASWPYDGKEHATNGWSVVDGSFVAGEGLESLSMTADSRITDHGETNNVIDAETLVAQPGTDLNNYDITTVNGKLMISAVQVYGQAPDIEKEYDGALTNIAVTLNPPFAGSQIAYATDSANKTPPDAWLKPVKSMQAMAVRPPEAPPEEAFKVNENPQYSQVCVSNKVWYRISDPKGNYSNYYGFAYVTITPRPVQFRFPKASKVYDGTGDYPQGLATNLAGAADNMVGSETFDCTATGHFTNVNVGASSVYFHLDTVTLTALGGAATRNYDIRYWAEGAYNLYTNTVAVEKHGTDGEITAKPMTVDKTDIVREYDGHATNIVVTVSDPPTGATIEYCYDAGGGASGEWKTYEDFGGFTHVTNNAVVWFRVTDATGNYLPTDPDRATVTITKAPVTVQAGAVSKKPGDPDPTPFPWGLVDETQLAPGDTNAVYAALSNVVELVRTAGEAAGDYVITTNVPFARDYPGTPLADYRLAFKPGKLTISARVPLAIRIADRTITYGQAAPTDFAFLPRPDRYTCTELPVETDRIDGENAMETEPRGFRTDYVKGASIGDYAIGTNGTKLVTSAYYDITIANGALTVEKAKITAVGPGEEPPTDPDEAYTQATNLVKVYDGAVPDLAPKTHLPFGDTAAYLYSTNSAGPFVAREALAFKDVMFDDAGLVTSNRLYYTVATTKGGRVNYFAATNVAWVTILPRPIALTSGTGSWEYDGAAHKKEVVTVTGGDGFAPGESFVYANFASITEVGTTDNTFDYAAAPGTDLANYDVTAITYGTLTITAAPTPPGPTPPEPTPPEPEPEPGEAELTLAMAANLNWDTGLIDLTLTVENTGDGSTAATDDYWVQLKPGPAETGEKATVAQSYYLNAPTGTTAEGYDVINLTAAVKAALQQTGNRDEVFDPGEKISVDGVSVYHWKRYEPSTFIDATQFFLFGTCPTLTETVRVEIASARRALAVPATVDATSAETSVSRAYNGVLLQDETLAGTMQLTLAKRNKKTGLSKLTAKVMCAGAQAVSLAGSFDATVGTFAATARDGTELTLVMGLDGFYGTYGDYAVEGARNRYGSKTAEDKAVVADADPWIGTYAIASPVENGYDTFTMKIAKKGKATLAGTLADGTKVSASAQMIIGADGCCVPVVWSKKGVTRTFCVWFSVDATSLAQQIEITGLENAIVSAVGNLADESTFLLDDEPFATVVPSGKKWVVTSEAKLKLTFNAKTGAFTGSYKAAVDGKSKNVTVSGVVVDGAGYGTATAKGLTPLSVTIE